MDLFEKSLDDDVLSLEFQPEETGLYEIRLFSDRTNHFLFSTFEINVYDTSNLEINAADEACIGKQFTFSVALRNSLANARLNVLVEQDDHKIKVNLNRLPKKLESEDFVFEISFTPEIEVTCRVEVECLDLNENIICGNVFKLSIGVADYIVMPYPLDPFPIKTRNFFICKLKDITSFFSIIFF